MTRRTINSWCACCVIALVLLGAATILASNKANSPAPTHGDALANADINISKDGTPDFLRLDSASDRDAFRRWFAAIAEYQALRPAQELPPEINDCAALLRYSYRGALHAHTEPWLDENKLAALAFLPSVRKYVYPRTPLGSALFRVRPVALAESLKSSFAEFADARTLLQLNTS